jgi:hypothetical protein
VWRKLAGKWRALDWGERFALLEAAWNLAAAQAAVRLLPFRTITPSLGRPGQAAQPAALAPEQEEQARQVGWAVQSLAHYLPWDAKCLAQAMAARWMLRRRRLPSTFYLGVDHGQDKWLEAHAWLRCGNEIVTGAAFHERFKVIAAFTEEAG